MYSNLPLCGSKIATGESISAPAFSRGAAKAARSVQRVYQIDHWASHERFCAPDAWASIALGARQGDSTAAPCLVLPSPAPKNKVYKSGTFYLAERRNFLLCVDTKPEHKIVEILDH